MVATTMLSHGSVFLSAVILLIACPRLPNALRFSDAIDKDFGNMARLRLSDFSQVDQSTRNSPDFVRALIEAIRLRDAYGGTNPSSEAAAAAAGVQRGYDDIRQEDGGLMPDDDASSSSSSSSSSLSSALRTSEDNALVRRTGPSAKSRRGDVSVSQLAELLNTLKSRGTEEGGLPPLQSLRFG